MRKSRFTETEIVYAVKQAEAGVPVAEVACNVRREPETIYAWRTKYGGLTVSEVPRLKQLEDESRKLKQMVAELSLDKQMLQDVLRKNSEARRGARSDPASHRSPPGPPAGDGAWSDGDALQQETTIFVISRL